MDKPQVRRVGVVTAPAEQPTRTASTIRCVPNGDRHTKCASCRATATHLLFNDAAVITKLRSVERYNDAGVLEVYEWSETTPACVSTCGRHAALNERRAAEAQGRIIDRRNGLVAGVSDAG